ncbi:MAG: AAA family ATPase [Pseudomonadota bacterium]
MAKPRQPVLTTLIREGRTFAVHRGVMPDGRRVVCKSVAAKAQGISAKARLENEYRITRALKHPNHSRAIDMIESERGPMLLFPDDGLTSLDLLATGPMDPEDVRIVAGAAGAALADLHNQGILHRDVKPSNIVASADLRIIRLIDHCLAVHEDELDETSLHSGHGTGAFMAPEQSGRMNRQVDHRADLYSLGITLYTLLTGRPPFEGSNQAELVFRHMTEVPPEPSEVNPDVPEVMSRAVMTLIEKNPEDRFQRAEDFLMEIRSGGKSPTMRLALPDQLYGRDDLIRQVSKEIAGSLRGKSRFIRIAGPSGIGKSALMQAILTPTVAAGGTVLHGKFDQLERAKPYSAFLLAANLLLRRILAGPAEELDVWRQRIISAVSPNGQVLLEILPNFESLIGAQPPVAELGLNEARIRMALVFRRFVRALARDEAPLILFFDDLQWADAASRQLIMMLLSDPEISNLTIICAYRENEVAATHPVSEMFVTLEENGVLEPAIRPGPLNQIHIAQLLSDTLDQSEERVSGLASLINAKTGGNPFFVRQFILALLRKGFIEWDAQGDVWRWDLATIRSQEITDNVADLVSERLLELPSESLRVVQLAACFGNSFETQVLALAEDRSAYQIAQLLKPAVQADIIRATDDGQSRDGWPLRYRFQHDRVQSAAYEALSEEQRSQLHARIGGLLLNRTPGRSIDTWLIEITDHLIAGQNSLDAPLRLCLRDLALASARRTRQSNAWDSSLRYLAVAEDMLGSKGWEIDPSLMFDVTLQKAEAAYLQNDTQSAWEITEALLEREIPLLNRVRVLELQIVIQTSKLEYNEALKVGQHTLSLLDEHLPDTPSIWALIRYFIKTKISLSGRKEKSLLHLPMMQDPLKLATVRVLGLMAAPAYFAQKYLLPMIGLRIIDLSIRHGNAPHSPYGYVIYGMLHCAALGRPEQGTRFAELGRQLAVEMGAQDIEARVLVVFGGFIQHWTSHLSDTLPIFEEAWEKAIAAGDLEYHGYARYGHASYSLMAGHSLPRVAGILDGHLAAITDNYHEKTQRIMIMARASIARMRGLQPDQSRPFNTSENYKLWVEQADATSLAYFHKFAMLEAMMVGDYEGVLTHTQSISEHRNGIVSMAYQAYYRFYEALAAVELARSERFFGSMRLRWRARKLKKQLQKLSQRGSSSQEHRAVLLQAELDAIKGRHRKAVRGFETAIKQARSVNALHDLGLFYERAARYHMSQGAEAAAAAYLTEARAAHEMWGAAGWITHLDQRFPGITPSESLRVPSTISASAADTTSGNGQIVDSSSLISAATALAQKTSLSDVVGEVMRAMVMNAGADRGVLLLRDHDDMRVAAETYGDDTRIIDLETAYDFTAVPRSVVNFVRRATTHLVLDDASVDPSFGEDPYIQAARPASVLCVPLLAKGDLTGVVYLENAKVRGAFTPERCTTITVLGAQAAVSVENARLFDELRGALNRQVELTSAHARFVPHSFLQVLNRPSIDQIELGDHVLSEASILFSDIRGFTARVESMGAAEAIEFINAYLSRMEPAVQDVGGFVDSYIGDALMAVFDRGPEHAITSALAMIRGLRAWSRADDPDNPIKIGIGIATGEIMFGTIGAANRMKCGVIGSTVNLASRVEEMTKRYGLGLLITQGTYRTLPNPDLFQIREVDLVTVVGREAPVRLFEVYDADPKHLREQKRRTSDAVSRGLRMYRSGAVDQALEIFEQCASISPDDPLIPVMLDRCRRARGLAKDPKWDGADRAAER